MTHRKLTTLTVGALLAALPAASAAETEGRTKSGQYHVVAGSVDETQPSLEGEFSNAVAFTSRPGERFVAVSIKDKSGLPTRALVVQQKRTDFGPRYVLKEEICGATRRPIAIRSHLAVEVLVQEGPCADGTTAAATTGTVTATFTR